MDFTAPDRISVDVADLGGLSDEITIECWVYGDPDTQPQNGTLFEGLNANNQRVVNVHLPWGNGRVYWDCGWDGGYDRIDAQAATADYEGQWNHWAFVKNATTGVMEMYLNGVLFHSGTDKDNPIEGIVRMNLGCSGTGTNHYNGRVDDFRVWGKALDGETIAEWMNHQPTAFHPDWDDLLVDYHFDGANGTEEVNHKPGGSPGFTTAPRCAGRRRAASGSRGARPHSVRTSASVVATTSRRWPMAHPRPAPGGPDEPLHVGGAGQRGRHDRPHLPLRSGRDGDCSTVRGHRRPSGARRGDRGGQ